MKNVGKIRKSQQNNNNIIPGKTIGNKSSLPNEYFEN